MRSHKKDAVSISFSTLFTPSRLLKFCAFLSTTLKTPTGQCPEEGRKECSAWREKTVLGRRESIWFSLSRDDRTEGKGREKKKHANAFRVMIKDCYREKGAKLCVY